MPEPLDANTRVLRPWRRGSILAKPSQQTLLERQKVIHAVNYRLQRAPVHQAPAPSWRKFKRFYRVHGRAAAVARLRDLLFNHGYSVEGVARAESVPVQDVRYWMRKLHVSVRGSRKLREELLRPLSHQ